VLPAAGDAGVGQRELGGQVGACRSPRQRFGRGEPTRRRSDHSPANRCGGALVVGSGATNGVHREVIRAQSSGVQPPTDEPRPVIRHRQASVSKSSAQVQGPDLNRPRSGRPISRSGGGEGPSEASKAPAISGWGPPCECCWDAVQGPVLLRVDHQRAIREAGDRSLSRPRASTNVRTLVILTEPLRWSRGGRWEVKGSSSQFTWSV
jgi:hypothetical protein